MEERNLENQQDPARSYSTIQATKRVDQDTMECLRALAESDREAITRHIEELDREWDVERYLQTNASLLTLAGVLLGTVKSRKWLILPSVVMPFLLQHGLQGWCPPLPLFRLMGVRTRKEINREKYALKALRGDFADLAADAARGERSA